MTKISPAAIPRLGEALARREKRPDEKEVGRDSFESAPPTTDLTVHLSAGSIGAAYIGETEKNLAHSAEPRSPLFFDEADALFGKRSEVRDGHDRFSDDGEAGAELEQPGRLRND